MHQLIDKRKLYFYLILLFILISVHNLNLVNTYNKTFDLKKIELISDLEDNINKKILDSFNQYYNLNIFSLKALEFQNILDNFNIISEYKIKKNYPSDIRIELKQTSILAYYYDNNQITYIGANGKKIKDNLIIEKKLPLIVGEVDINKFLDLKNKLIKYEFNLNEFEKFFSFNSKRWDLLYKNKVLVKLPIEDLDSSIILFKNIIKLSDSKNIKIIDLRIKNKIIIS